MLRAATLSLLLPFPAVAQDRGMPLDAGQVGIEYIAHACFRIHTSGDARILVDPYASRVWIGYDFPSGLDADAILITHPHYDHDGGQRLGRPVPWDAETVVLTEPGTRTVGDARVTGVRGKHADPYGKEFGQKNTIWLIEVDGLRIVHLGDNGPLTEENVRELGRVDVLLMPIDAEYHILARGEIEDIRAALHPRILVPMHYRHPDLEADEGRPSDLGPIDPWLAGQENVTRLESHTAVFSAHELEPGESIVAFRHSPRVAREIPREALGAFERTLAELAEAASIPGMSAAVVHRRRVVWSAGYGHADLEQDTFAEPTTRYRIASLSKTLAAVLVMQLVEEGKLSLDRPMADFWIPRWFAPDPARYREKPILVRHVLSHTSEGEPGEAYSYNGNVYADLTYVLEQVTGKSYARLLQERIFGPLGMERSTAGHVHGVEADPLGMARPYRWDGTYHVRASYQMMDPDPGLDLTDFDPVFRMPAEALARREELLGAGFAHLNGVSAAGGVVTTVLDLAEFDIALDTGRLIGAEQREVMFTPARSSAGEVLPYALGWFVEEVDGVRVAWHYGWLPPAVSALYVKVPERELTFLLAANNDRLSAGRAWTASGVRASPFARAFLDAFVPSEGG